MFGLRKLIFGSGQALDPAVAEAIEAWRQLPEPDLGELNFHCRYVVLDIATTGNRPESDALRAIAALGVERGGRWRPDDACWLELPADDSATEASTVDLDLVAFLRFIGKAPLVTYHAPYVAGFLQRLFRERLGLEFSPRYIDLAWLTPAMFSEVATQARPLDDWLAHFAVEFAGRRDVMDNTLQLARLFQRVLARAGERGVDTPEKLLQESGANRFLRRSH